MIKKFEKYRDYLLDYQDYTTISNKEEKDVNEFFIQKTMVLKSKFDNVVGFIRVDWN